MRHRTATTKLGRKTEHRQLMLANQVCSLIIHNRITTTLAKAKAVRPLAEKMVTLGKEGSLHARRNALAVLRRKDATKRLFEEVAPRCTDRAGGYTRIVKLGPRQSDAAPMAIIEWVDSASSAGLDSDNVAEPAETTAPTPAPRSKDRSRKKTPVEDPVSGDSPTSDKTKKARDSKKDEQDKSARRKKSDGGRG